MNDASTLRRKAARFFEDAASSKTVEEAEQLNELGLQFELWADELEEIHDAPEAESVRARE